MTQNITANDHLVSDCFYMWWQFLCKEKPLLQSLVARGILSSRKRGYFMVKILFICHGTTWISAKKPWYSTINHAVIFIYYQFTTFYELSRVPIWCKKHNHNHRPGVFFIQKSVLLGFSPTGLVLFICHFSRIICYAICPWIKMPRFWAGAAG